MTPPSPTRSFDPFAQACVEALERAVDRAFVEKVRGQLKLAPEPRQYRRRGDRTLIMLYAGRSGSTYAVQLLSNHPELGRAHEWFAPRALENYRKRHKLATHSDCLQHILDQQAGRILACKSIPMSIASAALLGYLDQFLDGVHFIRLRRRDEIAQAVSILRGRLTGHYHSTDGKSGEVDPEAFDYDRIAQHRQTIRNVHERHDRILAAFGKSANDYYYEDIADDPAAFLAAVCGELRLEIPEGIQLETRVRKLPASVSADWIARTREIDAARGFA